MSRVPEAEVSIRTQARMMLTPYYAKSSFR